MATRVYDFFGTRKEVLDILLPAIQERHLIVLRDGGGVEPMTLINPGDLRHFDPAKPARVQIATHMPPDEALNEVPIRPARWGWAGLDLPQERGDSLLMGELSATNDWSDGEVVHRSEETFSLFNDLQRIIRRKSAGSVRARSLTNGAVRVVRNVGLLESSRDWVARGGELRQEFVKNVVFEPT